MGSGGVGRRGGYPGYIYIHIISGYKAIRPIMEKHMKRSWELNFSGTVGVMEYREIAIRLSDKLPTYIGNEGMQKTVETTIAFRV